MIRINLLPQQEAQLAAGRRQEMAVAALALGVAVFGLVLAHTWQQARISSANRELGRLGQELAAIQGPYADVTRMELQKKELREKLKVIGELEARKVGPVKALADLSSATPDKLWLTDFSETAGTVKLSGLGVDEQTVADFLRRLAASSMFKAVDLEETSQVDQDGVKHKKFVIKSQVSYLAEAPKGPMAAADGAPGGQP
ncbi:MAG: PilN domain-containing protein [Acidimicrobiales bacterium]